jgi:hypothetical protein
LTNSEPSPISTGSSPESFMGGGAMGVDGVMGGLGVLQKGPRNSPRPSFMVR